MYFRGVGTATPPPRYTKADAPDGWWWLSSFGAGFSCHGALLKVH